MINQALVLVLDTLFSLFILAALVRFWMQALRAPSRNPIAQFTMALTDWAVKPLRRVIPGFGKLDWSSLVVALAFEFVLQLLLLILAGGSALDNPNVLSVLLFMSFVKLVDISPIFVFIFFQLLLMIPVTWLEAETAAMLRRALL